MTKGELRKLFLRKRVDLPAADYFLLNEKICDHFFEDVDLTGVRVLHTFLPIEKNREVNTWLIIDRLKLEFPSLRIAVPKINNQSGLLDNFYFEEAGQLENNLWGIPEPKYGVPTPTKEIDAVLVPLLACDAMGHRVGYGRGFYDKFLSTCRPDCRKIGLSFFDVVDKIAGTSENDVRLNLIVTPEKSLVFE